MSKPEIKVNAVKEDAGYSGYCEIGDKFIATGGATFEELKNMVLGAVNLALEDEGFSYSIDEVAFHYDRFLV